MPTESAFNPHSSAPGFCQSGGLVVVDVVAVPRIGLGFGDISVADTRIRLQLPTKAEILVRTWVHN
jgi:hypothetical protein